MFNLSDFSADVREAFRDSAAFWPITVDAAIKSGVRDPDKLADLVFYMHHPERMTGNKGRALDPSEPNFDTLVEEWQAFRSIVLPMLLPTVPKPPTNGDDWELNDKERKSLSRVGGKALVEWAELPPMADVETMAFASGSADIKRILAWKSRNPGAHCAANPKQRIQLFLMPPDSIDYWKKRHPEGNTALIKSTAIRSSNRAYRKHILEDKICPKGAFNLEVEDSRSLILQMAGGLFAMMPIPGVGGQAKFGSLNKLVEAMASVFQGAD